MPKLLNALVREERGQDVVEYALLVAGIALVIGTGANAFGNRMSSIYDDVATAVDNLIP